MSSISKLGCLVSAFSLVILQGPEIAVAQHAGDVFVGRSSSNQLKIGPTGSGGYVPDDNIKVLPPVSGIFNGWSDNNPGFDHIVTDQPALDFYILQSGTQVRLQLVQCDPAFKTITAGFAVIDQPGESALLGNQSLHTHLTWLIDSDDPAFDPLKVLWRATFRLVDTGSTGYSESAPFTFHFANVDCLRGDCDGSGAIDGGDVQAFVNTILNPAAVTGVDRCRADLDRDGYATTADIGPFVDKLLAS
jgi:hypothetical protein